MSVFEMAQRYYPRLWDRSRIVALVQAGRLTEGEYEIIVGTEREGQNGQQNNRV